MSRFFRDKALIEYFKSQSVPVDRALSLFSEGYEPQEIVRMLTEEMLNAGNIADDGCETSDHVKGVIYQKIDDKRNLTTNNDHKGSLVTLSREYRGIKLAVFFITHVEVYVSIFDTVFVLLMGVGTVEILSDSPCVTFPVTELLIEAADFHTWLRNYDSAQVDQVDESLPFLFGSSGFIITGDMLESSPNSSRIQNRTFFLYSSELRLKDTDIRIPPFKKKFSDFSKGKKSLDILIRTNWFKTNRIGANVNAMKHLVEDFSFNPVALLISQDDFSIHTTNELGGKIYPQKEHLGGRVDLTSSFFSSSLVDILSCVNQKHPIKPNLLDLIDEFSSSEMGFMPVTVGGDRAEFGTKAVTSISDLRSPITRFKPVKSVHDFITLNANCARKVLLIANTSLGEFYSAFLN